MRMYPWSPIRFNKHLILISYKSYSHACLRSERDKSSLHVPIQCVTVVRSNSWSVKVCMREVPLSWEMCYCATNIEVRVELWRFGDVFNLRERVESWRSWQLFDWRLRIKRRYLLLHSHVIDFVHSEITNNATS